MLTLFFYLNLNLHLIRKLEKVRGEGVAHTLEKVMCSSPLPSPRTSFEQGISMWHGLQGLVWSFRSAFSPSLRIPGRHLFDRTDGFGGPEGGGIVQPGAHFQPAAFLTAGCEHHRRRSLPGRLPVKRVRGRGGGYAATPTTGPISAITSATHSPRLSTPNDLLEHLVVCLFPQVSPGLFLHFFEIFF